MRRFDGILLTLVLIVCGLFVRACRHGDWPFTKVATVAKIVQTNEQNRLWWEGLHARRC